MKIWDILHKFWVVILWLTLGFGAAGSLRGASVESKIRSDIHHTIPAENEVGTTLPYMTGWFDLSKDQNLWYSFSYALMLFNTLDTLFPICRIQSTSS